MYTFETMISYSAVDRNGNLPLYGILNLLQDCTNMQSSSIGMGVEHMKQVNKGWILVSYKISLKKKLRYGEKVRVGTAASSFSSFYGDRKFQIESLDGEKLVEADSIWVLMDMETRHPIRVSEEERKGYVIEELGGYSSIVFEDYIPNELNIKSVEYNNYNVEKTGVGPLTKYKITNEDKKMESI